MEIGRHALVHQPILKKQRSASGSSRSSRYPGYQVMLYYDSRDRWRIRVMPSSYTIGKHFEHFVKEQVEGGSYASASEVIRDGLRLLEEDQQRRQAVLDGLRGEIERGRRSGKPKPAAVENLAREEGIERGETGMEKDGLQNTKSVSGLEELRAKTG